MVQPKVFLWEPAWIPWWLHFKKPSKLFRSCCNIPIRATTIIHYRLFHSNFPVSSFFLLVVKSFRGNIELHWPPPTPTAKTVLAVREVWLPGLKFLQKNPTKQIKKITKQKKTKTLLWPHISRGCRVAALIPGLPTLSPMPMMLTGCLKLGETDQSEHETSVCHVLKRKKKILSSVMKMSFFLCSWYMWLYILCYWEKNVKTRKKLRSAISNWKVKYIKQTNKKRNSPLGFPE